MTPFQWGLLTGGFLGFLVSTILWGMFSLLTAPRRRPREIGRDEITQLKR